MIDQQLLNGRTQADTLRKAPAWLEAVFAEPLVLIHPTVRFGQQLLGVAAVGGIHRYADARAQKVFGEDLMAYLLDYSFELFELCFDVFLLHPGQQNYEFVSAHAGDVIVFAANRLKPAGDAAKNLVAIQVAEAIIDLLEPIQIGHEHRQRLNGTAASRKLGIELKE